MRPAPLQHFSGAFLPLQEKRGPAINAALPKTNSSASNGLDSMSRDDITIYRPTYNRPVDHSPIGHTFVIDRLITSTVLGPFSSSKTVLYCVRGSTVIEGLI